MNEFERLGRIIGNSNLDKIRNTTVVVLGLGGVGGYTAESLVRSGIGKLILVDYDTIDITNINRQLIADTNSVGLYKADAWKDRINLINSNCIVKIIKEKIIPENIDLLFEDNPDYIVDAIDYMETKKSLILECIKRNVKIISSMGTGNKMNPSKLEITDIKKTSYDPIAKTIRRFVKDNKINKKVMVICSTEIPKKVSNPVGSNAFVPATAGLLCTSYVINDIVGDLNDTSK